MTYFTSSRISAPVALPVLATTDMAEILPAETALRDCHVNLSWVRVLSDKCEPVSEWPVTVALCRTELAPLSESSGAVKLEIDP